jgi:glucan biosynthesis protein C
MRKQRLYYLDNLRVWLTILVLFFHAAITYGGGGGWYYKEVTGFTPTSAVLSLFTAVDQAFFMGLFFFLSAYFTPGSVERKGKGMFLRDRLIRLGIPLLVYLFLISPLMLYLLEDPMDVTLWSFYQVRVLGLDWDVGPLWFAEALLIFAGLYLLTQRLLGTARTNSKRFPSNRAIFLGAILLGLAIFAVRLVFPVGMTVLGLQLAYFPSYIFLFVLGIVAYNNEWLEQLTEKQVKFWFRLALVAIPVQPVAMMMTGVLEGKIEFVGGWNIQALVYAMWEPFVCFGICLYLLWRFRERRNEMGPFRTFLSDTAYTVYVIHPPVLVLVAVLLIPLSLPAFVKFLILGVVGTALCYVFGYVIRMLPYAKRVL